MKFAYLFISVLFSFTFGTTAATCTDANVKISYGPCINNKRDIVFYVTNESCDPTGYTVPTPIRNKECDFACPAGNFYNLSSHNSTCTPCPEGHEADGFAIIYDNLTPNNIAPFVSTCNGSNCLGWTVWGNYLTTGFQPSNTHVNLSLSVNIFQTSGKVLFEYTCPETRYQSAELHFYIDGHRMNNISYISDLWKSDEFLLPFGQHELLWEFQTYYSYNASEIGARLRNVEIRGTKYLVTGCKACPRGSTSKPGEECKPCSYNEVPVTNGMCGDCGAEEFSYPGDDRCQPRKDCQASDYYWEYGSCIGGQQVSQQILSHPKICKGPEINGTRERPCPKCDPGHYKLNAECVPCPDGLYRNENMTDDKCESCAAGTYATRNDLHMRPDITNHGKYSTGCVSDDKFINNCATEGWIEGENIISSGNHFGPVTVWLNRTINSKEYGTVYFSYTTRLRNDSYFKFYSTQYAYHMVNSSSNGAKHNFSAPYYSGITNFSFIFIKTCHNNDDTCSKGHDNSNPDTVEIDELSFSTESLGGGTECSVCDAGTFSDGNVTSCTNCPKGTYSDKNATNCTVCPPGKYAPEVRSTECFDCLNNTQPNVCPPTIEPTPCHNSSQCVFVDCGFQHNSTYSFSLAALETKDNLLNATRPNNETRLFYLDICTMNHSNETCKDWFDEEPDSGDNAWACTVTTNSQYYYSWSLGTKAEMNYLEERSESDGSLVRYGVNVTYSEGASQYCQASKQYLPNSLEIVFYCVPESGIGEPLPAAKFEDDNCRYHYEWTTEYACRICTQNDYENLAGACVKGKKNSTWVLKQGQSICTHGFAPETAWQISSCPNPLVKLSAGAVVGIVLGAVILLGLAIFFIVYYIRKNRALRYQLFQKGNFSLQVERSDDEGAAGAGGDYAPSTSMFGGGGGQEEQYKSVDFSGSAVSTDNAY